MEQATYELIPVIYITGNTHPDHNSINSFCKRFLEAMKDLFTQILLRAYDFGVLRLGEVSLDGTKIHANAGKHKALSWEYANRLEEQQCGVRAIVAALLKKAEAADGAEPVAEMKVGEEVALRQAHLQQIGAAPCVSGIGLPKGKQNVRK